MRVALITKSFTSSLEPLGAPFERRQASELAKRCEVDVFAAVPRVGTPLAVPLYVASLLPHRDRLRSADVLLATSAYPDGCAGLLVARLLGKPFVVKVHGTDLNVFRRGPLGRAVAARALPMAAAIVAASRSIADSIVHLGGPPERVHVVRNGADLGLFTPRSRRSARHVLGLPPDAPLVLYVGRIERDKGVLDLLDAFEWVRARAPSTRLVFVGHGSAEAEVRSRAAQHAEGAVRTMGQRPHAEVAEWLGASDLVVFPSHEEGTPSIVLEALATGRPVVATRVGGIPDVLSDACGILVAPRDTRALAGAITAALSRSWDEAAIVAHGPASWEASAVDLLRVLESAAGAGAGAERRVIDDEEERETEGRERCPPEERLST
jgi:glycosyltransferase involved in cell wall biosynthesis